MVPTKELRVLNWRDTATVNWRNMIGRTVLVAADGIFAVVTIDELIANDSVWAGILKTPTITYR